jgi:hypothetical protein
MRKIIIQEFISLDGVMQAPGGPEEDISNGFKYGGWTAPYFYEADEEADSFMQKNLKPMSYSRPTGLNMPICGLASMKLQNM